MTAPRCTCAAAISRPDPLCPVHSPFFGSLGEMEERRDAARQIERVFAAIIALIFAAAICAALTAWSRL